MSKDELEIYTHNGQMKTWASQSYMHMRVGANLHDGEVTYNVHTHHMQEVNLVKPGSLVTTNEDEIGLVLEWVSKDIQGFDVYKVMIEGKELLYSTLELAIVGE